MIAASEKQWDFTQYKWNLVEINVILHTSKIEDIIWLFHIEDAQIRGFPEYFLSLGYVPSGYLTQPWRIHELNGGLQLGKSSINGTFSMAMLNNQMLHIYIHIFTRHIYTQIKITHPLRALCAGLSVLLLSAWESSSFEVTISSRPRSPDPGKTNL